MTISDTRGSVLGTVIRAVIDKWRKNARGLAQQYDDHPAPWPTFIAARVSSFHECADDLSAALTAVKEDQCDDAPAISAAEPLPAPHGSGGSPSLSACADAAGLKSGSDEDDPGLDIALSWLERIRDEYEDDCGCDDHNGEDCCVNRHARCAKCYAEAAFVDVRAALTAVGGQVQEQETDQVTRGDTMGDGHDSPTAATD